MTVIVHAPHTYLAERRYVLDVVLTEWLGLDYDLEFDDRPRVAIQLAGDNHGRELTLPDVLFATHPKGWLKEQSMPALPLTRVDIGPLRAANGMDGGGPQSPKLPVLFGDVVAAGRPWDRTATGIALAVDIFGSVFFLLTRYEEVLSQVRDRHDRFPASASIAAHEGFLHRPLADEYVDLLWLAMRALWPSLSRRATAFRLRLTHDVDQPWAALGQGLGALAHATGGDLLRRRDLGLAARRVRSLVDARSGRVDRDPFNTFADLMDTSERHGLTSVFYFMAGNSPTDFDFRYRLSDPPLIDLLRSVHERGHEVGLHASYMSYRSPTRIRAEFDALQASCRVAGFHQATWGVRQHYLRLANPDTWCHQESAGLEHDSTLGFAEQIGFRAGTCREYPLFDVVRRCSLKLVERPLVAMDATLLEYMGLSFDEAATRVRTVVRTCRQHNGDAVLLFHNGTLAGARSSAHYRSLVEALAQPD
jgi:hypothetical protein